MSALQFVSKGDCGGVEDIVTRGEFPGAPLEANDSLKAIVK